MAKSEGLTGWFAKFELSWNILEYSVSDVTGVTSDIKKNESGDVFLKGFSVQIPPSSQEEATTIALEKGNRISDYLSSIHRLPVEAYLLSINEIRPAGENKTGYSTFTLDAPTHQPVHLNWADVEEVIGCGDAKLLRQLAHYRMGLRYSQDPINQLREFYLVLEDEYEKGHPSLIPYGYVRNALFHPELDYPNQIKKLLSDIGEKSIDPSSPKAMALVKSKVKPLKEDAEKVISNILKSLSQPER